MTDGGRFWISDKLPKSWDSQKCPSKKSQKETLLKKVAKVIEKGYLVNGKVKNLTGFFAVPKGKDDIRVVYDVSAYMLNSSLWAPNFELPTIDTVLRSVNFNSWFGDANFGEHFLNFPLDKGLRPYAGVDVTVVQRWMWTEEIKGLHSQKETAASKVKIQELTRLLEKKGRIIKRWCRCLWEQDHLPIILSDLLT